MAGGALEAAAVAGVTEVAGEAEVAGGEEEGEE